MIAPTAEARRAFVLANTRLQRPPLTPELALHLADEITPIWRSTEEALQAVGVPPPFWAFAWAGGQALARYVLDHAGTVAGLRVLDFAAGSGLVAIAARLAGASSVLAADVDRFSGAAVALNAAANGVEIDITAEDLLAGGPPAVDLVLAGDICYEMPLARDAVAWLAAARRAGAQVLIGDPERAYLPRERLARLAEYQTPTTRELEDQEVKRTGVWRFADDDGAADDVCSTSGPAASNGSADVLLGR